jgi:cellulose synthase (UDP-forming)
VYDPDAQLSANDSIAIDHTFITWTDPEAPAQIKAAFAKAKARNRWLMLTIEPWFASGRQSDLVLSDILKGAYDTQIDTMCRSVAALGGPVYMRWGHEMETKTGRYSWANDDPAGYVASYRRFADHCRAQTDKLLWVWSPAGDQRLDEFFPGAAYVDFVGLSVYDCPWCGIEPAGGTFSAASIFREKYKRVRHFGLPVMIAELGIDGDAERKRKNLQELMSSLSRYPLLRAVFYFNAPDTPGVWMDSYRPDWRLHQIADAFRQS